MKTRILLLLVLPIFLLAIFAGGALAKNKSSNYDASVALPVDGGSQTPGAYFTPTPVMYEGNKGDCDNINPEVTVYEEAQWGSTYYDYQKNGSMGRMIAVGPGGYRHMVFHKTYGPYDNATFPRYVMYNCEDPANAWLGPTKVDGGINLNSGYTNIALTHTGRELVIFHRGTAGGCTWYSCLKPADAGYICQGYFDKIYDLPDLIEGTPTAQNGMWPKHTVVYDALVDTDYIHIVVTQNVATTGDDEALGYERCVFQGDNLVCRTRLATGPVSYTVVPNVQGSPTLNKIGVFDTVKCIAAIPVHSPVSGKVAIVYTKHRSDAQHNNDVYYIESTNNGDDWLDGTHWGATLVKHNITNYPALGTERAYTDVAACYDYNDSLHIVWTGCFYDSVAGTFDPIKSNLYHWSKATGKVMIAPGQWANTKPGAWNRNISKMSISAIDPIYHPGGTPDSVFLFVTWTQFNPGDTSRSGMGNGDIYAAVSNNGGQTWTPGYNLTNTPTPNCLPGACLSEHWSSMAENMYNGQLHIEYVCDRDAGGCVQPSEGTWTDNPMMYIRVAQPSCGPCPCGITYTIVDPPSWTEPPVKVSPSGTRTFSFNVSGIYNLGGNYSVTSNHPKVTCISNCSGYLSPNQTKDVVGLITCTGEEFINAIITVHGCVGTAEEDSFKLPLYAVCDSNDYYECKRARETKVSMFSNLCSLWVCANTSQEVYDLRVRDDHGNAQRSIFSSGVIVATSSGSDTVIGRQEDNFTRTGARDTIMVYTIDETSPGTCRIQRVSAQNTYIWYPPVIPQHPVDPKWWWISINKQVIFFTDIPGQTCPEWKKEQVIKRVWIRYARPPVWWPNPGLYAGHGDIYFGVFADPDAPSDTGCGSCNTAGWDNTRKMMWQHGRYAGEHPDYNDYYIGLALTDTSGAVVDPYAAKDVTNDTFIYPQSGWRDDQLFQLASTPGVSIYLPDSVKDRSMVLTAYKIPAGSDTAFQSEFILIEALIKGNTGTGLQQLQTHIDQTRGTLIPELKALGLFQKTFGICGDITGNGVVDASDLVYLLNYLFVNGPAPPWPQSRADVNGDYKIDAADFIYLCNYLYHYGSAPPNCPGYPGYIPPSWGQDPLNRDTVYVRVEDPKLTPEGTDIPITIWGSNDENLQAILTPFCWTGDCYLDAAKNSRSPQSQYYIFRNYAGIPNRLKPYLADSAWSAISDIESSQILLFANGPCYPPYHDLRPGSGLLATFVFTCNQPTPPPIDTCFWPPSHHLLFVEPNNNYFVPQFRRWEPVDCDRSFSDICLVACPLGDIPFNVHLRDSKNNAVVNYSNVWLDFSGCSGIVPCPTEPSWPIVNPDGPSDANGVVTFHVHAGGCDNVHRAQIRAGCGLIVSDMPIKTVDTDGDLMVEVSDWHHTGVDPCNDYNCNGEINYWDLAFFRDHITHGCTVDPCLSLVQDLTVTPDTLLPVDSTHTVRLFIRNNYTQPCTAQYVKFYRAGFGQGSTQVQFAYRYLGRMLMPGDTVSTEADFVVPGPGSGYILTKFYTNCCSHSIDATFDFTKRMCPPDSMVYTFPLNLGFTPTYVETLEYIPDTLGWYWYIFYTGNRPDSVAIVTPDTSILGVTGGVTLFFFDAGWHLLGSRACEVRITLNSGDVNSDCIVDASDLVYLLNYLFVRGPAPDPLRAGDLNCDCWVDISDVVYLINYLFIGGPPPVSSETCECGYKGWSSYR